LPERREQTGLTEGLGLTAPKALIQEISKRLDVSVTQGHMLLALLEYPAINHDLSEELGIFARSKLRERVLEPLNQRGFLIFHSLGPREGSVGAPRIAWSLSKEKHKEVDRAHLESVKACQARRREAEMLSMALCDEMGIPYARRP